MAKEIEAKFQIEEASLPVLTAKIFELGFVKVKNLDQKDTYFKHQVKPGLSSHAKTYLRVRTNNGVSATAMHYKNADYVWEEIETIVEDGDKVRLLYSNLGMEVDVEVHKLRSVFKAPTNTLENVEIVIDNLVGVGYFVEIEASTLDEVWYIAGKLGFTKEQADKIKDKSYADLVREQLALL